MSDKFIKLAFSNAKLFPKNIKTKDFIANQSVSSKGKLIFTHSKRNEEKLTSFKEPITVHQISNMLHTLVGERPVPSFRSVFYDKDKDIFELAKNSFIKFNSPKTKVKKGDVEIESYILENTKINKSVWNSWTKPNHIQWFKIKKYFGGDFDEFIDILNDLLGFDVTKKHFSELSNIKETYGEKLNPIIQFLKNKNKTPMINYLTKAQSELSEIVRSTSLGETINSGVDNTYFLDGEILVPFSDVFVSRLIKNTTSILDGGYVEILGVFEEYELYDTENFVSVSSISDEKF
jgi:hypothetical protein